jgi:hypothetical protein
LLPSAQWLMRKVAVQGVLLSDQRWDPSPAAYLKDAVPHHANHLGGAGCLQTRQLSLLRGHIHGQEQKLRAPAAWSAVAGPGDWRR